MKPLLSLLLTTLKYLHLPVPVVFLRLALLLHPLSIIVLTQVYYYSYIFWILQQGMRMHRILSFEHGMLYVRNVGKEDVFWCVFYQSFVYPWSNNRVSIYQNDMLTHTIVLSDC